MPALKDLSHSKTGELKIANGVILLLLFVVVASIAISITVMYYASHNVTASAYFTFSSMLGMNEEGFSQIVLASVVPYSSYFYLMMGILAIDGIVKYMIIGFGIAIMLDVLTGVDIAAKIMNMTKRNMKGHVVVCGYSAVGESLCVKLKDKGMKFLIIEKDPEKIESIKESGHIPIEGDFTEIKDMMRVNAQYASSIVFCGENDYTTLLGVVTARKLNRKSGIICRARAEDNVTKMQRAGADICMIPELMAGLELGEKLSGV